MPKSLMAVIKIAGVVVLCLSVFLTSRRHSAFTSERAEEEHRNPLIIKCLYLHCVTSSKFTEIL